MNQIELKFYLLFYNFDLPQKDIINRSEFNALMKYENVEFERNFQLKPNVRSPNEANTSGSSSVRPHQQTEKTHDDIQVISKFFFF